MLSPLTAPTPIEYYYREKPSFTMRFYEFALRHILRLKKKSEQLAATGKLTQAPAAEVPKLNGKLVALTVTQVQGRQVFTLRPKQAARASGKTVLYLHGGAYIYNFGKSHWDLLQTLVTRTGCAVVAPDYPLAPQFTYKETFALVEEVYNNLAGQVGAQNVLLMGDSAGGGLALALAEKLKRDHAALPAQLILLSPWLDTALENPDIKPVEPLDPMLAVEPLRLAARAYAGSIPLSNYQLSPINGDLGGLPRTSVFIGTHDIFVADARKFKQLMARQGNPINYFEYNGAIHVWVMVNSPESKRARQQLFDLLKS